MALDLRANTAVDVLIGPFLDDTDGKTAETGLTITQADVRLSKNGQNIAQKADVNAAAHDELGYHNCPLNTTDTNTEGSLVLAVHEAGALPVFHEYNIMAEAAWDSLYVAKDVGFMDVNIKTVGRADAQETEASNLESACSNYSVTRGLTGTALPAAVADAAGGLPISDLGGLDLDTQIGTDIDAILTDTGTTLDTLIKDIPTTAEFALRSLLAADYTVVGDLGTVQTGDSFAIVNGDHGLVSIQDDVDAILTDTGTTIPGTITTVQNDLDIITGVSGVIIQDGSIIAASLGADAITAAKVAADVHTENATAVWSKTESLTGNTHSFETVLVRLFRFFMNDINITDATGAVALRNEANTADVASQTITDNDTTTTRTDLVWA